MRYFSSKDYVLRTIAGENVLVSIRSSVADFSGVITLNPAATLIWKCLQGGATVEEMIQAMTEKFDVSESVAKEDICETIKMLESRKMIRHE